MLNPRISWLLTRPCARLMAVVMVAMVVALLPLAAFAAQITVDGTTCTLPDAITAANTNTATGGCTAGSGADTLLLTAAIYSLATGPYDHDGLTATPSVTSTIVINGGVDGAIIERSGNTKYRLFHVGESGILILQSLAVRYGNVNGSGGAIYNLGALTLSDSKIISNSASDSGGGLYNRTSTATITNSDFISNSAMGGGGLYNYYSSITTITNSDFIANTAEFGGGLINSSVSHPEEPFLASSTVTLTDSDFISNTATGSIDSVGGGLYNSYSTVTLTNSDFIGNAATGSNGGGGGLYRFSGNMTLTNSDFIANTTMGGGGGLYSQGYGEVVSVNITNCDFISNTSKGELGGGGLYTFASTTPVTITNSAFISNTAFRGGAIANSYSFATVTNAEIRANIAISSGGGIYQEGEYATVTIVNSRLLSNVAGGTGGAYQQVSGSSTIDHSCIVNNSDIAVNYVSGNAIDARNNWWGALDGPSGANPGSGDSVSSSATFAPILVTAPLGCPPIAMPTLEISKSANRSQAHVGDIISYTYRITNTGNITLTTISAVDNRLGPVSALAGQLPPALSSSATLTYVVQLSDLPDPLVNTVTVTGTDTYGTVVTDSASATVIPLPAEVPPILLPQIKR